MNALLASASTPPLADAWGFHDAGTGGWFVMTVVMVLFWGLIIFGVMRLLQGRAATPGAPAHETPVEILRRRLADGSLSPAQFEEHRRLLDDDGSAHSEAPGEKPAPRTES